MGGRLLCNKRTTTSTPYNHLTELGEGAVAHIMMEWKPNPNEQTNRIWEILINEIVHGRRPDDLRTRLGRWEDWNDWFENKDYDGTPWVLEIILSYGLKNMKGNGLWEVRKLDRRRGGGPKLETEYGAR